MARRQRAERRLSSELQIVERDNRDPWRQRQTHLPGMNHPEANVARLFWSVCANLSADHPKRMRPSPHREDGRIEKEV